MPEEHRCQTPRLCVNNCGFFGSPETQDLCSKCYRDLQLKEQQSSNAKLAFDQTLAAAAAYSPSAVSSSSSPARSISASVSTRTVNPLEVSSNQTTAVAKQQPASRCLTCKKRVGLTEFKCKCGKVFCGSHRHPDQHGCEFDFKGLGKTQIAKANPVIKAPKLDKM